MEEQEQDKEQEQINALNVLYALNKLHMDRTEAYIELYGYDTWEQTFQFPNYDYDYFENKDEEDEEYEYEYEEYIRR
jgi:hypothetical protein